MVPERTSGSLKQAVLTLPLTELAQGSQNHFKETYLLLFSYRNSSLWGGNSTPGPGLAVEWGQQEG